MQPDVPSMTNLEAQEANVALIRVVGRSSVKVPA